MQRDLGTMTSTTYDVIVVGGGITGACVARDAAMRGLTVALLEKNDFAHATTAASSKLIHGGLRYLRNGELGIVRKSLRERRIWSNIAPHMVEPISFMVPTTGFGMKGRFLMSLALTFYDALSYDRNRVNDPAKRIPSKTSLSRDEVIAREPGLDTEGLTGALVFYDCQTYSPERLALECVLDAAEHGAHVANYAEVTRFLHDGDAITGVDVHDALAGTEHTIRGRVTVNAGGPWADLLMRSMHGAEPARRLIRSKGIHIVTRPITNGNAISFVTEMGHFFIIPWRGHSLIGTTDVKYEGHPDVFRVTEEDIADFLAVVNAGYPAARLSRDDVLYFYGGLRPIVDQETDIETGGDDEVNTYRASRAAEIYDHEINDGIEGMITTIGGKWTTSRHLAEEVVDKLFDKLDRDFVACTTHETPTFAGDTGIFAEFSAAAAARFPELSEEVVHNLAQNYGSRIEDVVAIARQERRYLERISDTLPDIAAEAIYAVRNEMARNLDDVLFRRTGLGTLGNPGDAAIEAVAELMAGELGWDDAERHAQIEGVLRMFSPLAGAALA